MQYHAGMLENALVLSRRQGKMRKSGSWKGDGSRNIVHHVTVQRTTATGTLPTWHASLDLASKVVFVWTHLVWTHLVSGKKLVTYFRPSRVLYITDQSRV